MFNKLQIKRHAKPTYKEITHCKINLNPQAIKKKIPSTYIQELNEIAHKKLKKNERKKKE